VRWQRHGRRLAIVRWLSSGAFAKWLDENLSKYGPQGGPKSRGVVSEVLSLEFAFFWGWRRCQSSGGGLKPGLRTFNLVVTLAMGGVVRENRDVNVRACLVSLFALIAGSVFGQAGSIKDYRDFAMAHEGDVAQGKAIFNDEARAACVKCHTTDGSAGKAGPDLLAIGDKFPRRDLIEAVLEPSAAIAIGYGTTTVETKDGEEVVGIIKQSTDQFVDLMTAEGKQVRVAAQDIKQQRGNTLSLMPDGLQGAMSREQFTDLIEYLTTLRQPENALTANAGMPREIPALAKPVEVRPFFKEELRFPHAWVHKPGDVRVGLVAFAQAPGNSNLFFAVHQTGKIWLIEKRADGDVKTLFGDFGSEIFNERGPNGLLGLAFHPKFRENRKYYLKHQVFEDGKSRRRWSRKLPQPMDGAILGNLRAVC
jgi:putative heme-binding domain-containing protein